MLGDFGCSLVAGCHNPAVCTLELSCSLSLGVIITQTILPSKCFAAISHSSAFLKRQGSYPRCGNKERETKKVATELCRKCLQPWGVLGGFVCSLAISEVRAALVQSQVLRVLERGEAFEKLPLN